MSNSRPRGPDDTPAERRLPATGAMLKESLGLYRADAVRFVAVVAVLNVPLQLVTALLNLTAPRIPLLTVSALVNLPSLQGSTLRLVHPFTTAHLSAIVDIGIRAIGGFVLSSLVGVLTTAALATVIMGRAAGRPIGVGAAYRAVADRLGALLLAFCWAAIRFAVLFLLCPTIVGLVLFIYVLVAWALIPQAIMLEGSGSGGGAASGRSRRLVKGHWQQASNLFIVVVVLVLALIGVPSALLAAALGHALGLPSLLLQTALSILIALVVQPFAAVATTVLYIELKACAAAAPLLDAA